MRKQKSAITNSARLHGLLRNKLILETVSKNRYPDLGDWFCNNIIAVRQEDCRSTALVLVHELIEYILCTYHGISSAEVDKEDAEVLAGTKKKQQVSYWKYHLIATKIERLLALALDISWRTHERNCKKAFAKQLQLWNK